MKKATAQALFTILIILSATLVVKSEPSPQAAIEKSIISGDLDTATEQVESALEERPDSAQLHELAGTIYANRAQSASAFSAPGLAKKSLKYYKRAVALEPNNIQHHLNLMQYYLVAPSIVGGNKTLAAEQVKKITKLDPAYGIVAESRMHLANEDSKASELLFADLNDELSSKPHIKLAHALYLAQSNKFEQAQSILLELSKLNSHNLVGTKQKLIPYKALLQLGFMGLEDASRAEQGITAFKHYIESAPDNFRLISKDWVFYFLGISYTKANQSSLAASAFDTAIENTHSKNLLKEVRAARKNIK